MARESPCSSKDLVAAVALVSAVGSVDVLVAEDVLLEVAEVLVANGTRSRLGPRDGLRALNSVVGEFSSDSFLGSCWFWREDETVDGARA